MTVSTKAGSKSVKSKKEDSSDDDDDDDDDSSDDTEEENTGAVRNSMPAKNSICKMMLCGFCVE